MAKTRTEPAIASPDEARAALNRVQEAAERARAELGTRRGALAELEEEAGTRLFNARLNSDTDEETRIEQDLDIARKAVATAQKIVDASSAAIRMAQSEVWKAEACQIRADIATRRPDVEARLDHAAELLTTLHDVEGVHWLPQPHVAPSGAVAAGSWARTRTGEAVEALLMDERRAIALERQAGIESPPSVVAERSDLALHLGCQGTIEQAAPIAVRGSQLDDASAALTGREPAQQPTPDRDMIARQASQNRRMT
jgi:hypothetical protein